MLLASLQDAESFKWLGDRRSSRRAPTAGLLSGDTELMTVEGQERRAFAESVECAKSQTGVGDVDDSVTVGTCGHAQSAELKSGAREEERAGGDNLIAARSRRGPAKSASINAAPEVERRRSQCAVEIVLFIVAPVVALLRQRQQSGL